MPTDVALRLRRVEERLERLLVSGWRNVGPEAAELSEDADALDELGLGALAGRLRAVAASGQGAEALRTITLAATACRLVRARLPADAAPPGDWTPLGAGSRRRATGTERLLPLGRMGLPDGEAWACIRLRGGSDDGWLLLDPLPLPEPSQAVDPPVPGLVGRLLNRGRPSEVGNAGAAPWLRGPLEGALRWRARYPLGASSDVQHCRMIEPTWPAPADDEEPFATLRKTLAAGSLGKGRAVLGGWLRLGQLDPTETNAYLWPDPAVANIFRSGVSGPAWALAWVQGDLVAPLVLVEAGSRLRPPRLIHLVDGLPSEALRL